MVKASRMINGTRLRLSMVCLLLGFSFLVTLNVESVIPKVSLIIGILAVLFWLFRNTYYLTMCLFLGLGRDTDSENVKVKAAEMITIQKANGREIEGITTKLLEHGIDIFTDELDSLYLGEPICLGLSNKHYNLHLKGTVVAIHHSRSSDIPSVYTIEILDFEGQKDEYIQMLYDRTPTLPQKL